MQITTENEGLCMTLHGREQLWALRAKIFIAKKDITSIRYENEFNDWRKWEVRMPGASIPGRLVAGSFWTEEGWDFLYIINPRGFMKPKADNVLVIETKQERYKRIIVSYNQKEAEKLLKWWGKS